MVCDNFKHVINVEESFHSSPKILGSLEISWCLKIFRQFENLYAAQKIQITIVGPPNNNITIFIKKMWQILEFFSLV